MSNDDSIVSFPSPIAEVVADAGNDRSILSCQAAPHQAVLGQTSLCQGLLKSDGIWLVDPSALPWSAAERTSNIKLTAKDLRNEVERQSLASGNCLKCPHPKAWKIPRATQWLDENPITDATEVAFIHSTIAVRIHVAERAVAKAPGPSTNGGINGSGSVGNWVGMYPNLWLLHSIIDDNDVKTAYVNRNN